MVRVSGDVERQTRISLAKGNIWSISLSSEMTGLTVTVKMSVSIIYSLAEPTEPNQLNISFSPRRYTETAILEIFSPRAISRFQSLCWTYTGNFPVVPFKKKRELNSGVEKKVASRWKTVCNARHMVTTDLIKYGPQLDQRKTEINDNSL